MGNKLPSNKKSIFEFSVENNIGVPIKLSNFSGKKAYLVVNVVNNCESANHNYSELQELYGRCNSIGLEILAFPWYIKILYINQSLARIYILYKY
jgi:glutathione peroxidase-family protein